MFTVTYSLHYSTEWDFSERKGKEERGKTSGRERQMQREKESKENKEDVERQRGKYVKSQDKK